MAPRFALLHSPLLGPIAWRATAAALAAGGSAAETPAWRPLCEISDGFYGALTDDLAAKLADRGEPLVLVAHSGAGALVPAAAARLPGQVSAVIYTDSILPHPGRSWFDTAPAEVADRLRVGAQMGELPPWSDWWPPGALARLIPDADQLQRLIAELEPLPQAYFEEPAPMDVWTGPTAYLQLSGAYDAESQTAARSGWPLVRLPLHHVAMLTHPQAVAAALESLAERLAIPANG